MRINALTIIAMQVGAGRRKLDLLITDAGLPGMNGRQLAEIARQHPPQLPVLFMTGYAENATSRSKFLASGTEMIFKPFLTEALVAKIRGMKSNKSVGHAAVSNTEFSIARHEHVQFTTTQRTPG